MKLQALRNKYFVSIGTQLLLLLLQPVTAALVKSNKGCSVVCKHWCVSFLVLQPVLLPCSHCTVPTVGHTTTLMLNSTCTSYYGDVGSPNPLKVSFIEAILAVGMDSLKTTQKGGLAFILFF